MLTVQLCLFYLIYLPGYFAKRSAENIINIHILQTAVYTSIDTNTACVKDDRGQAAVRFGVGLRN